MRQTDAATAGPGPDAGTDPTRAGATAGAPGADTAEADAGAGTDSTGAGEGAVEACAGSAEPSSRASTSALVMRPSFPVPGIFDASSPCSSTSRRTAGLRRSAPAAAVAALAPAPACSDADSASGARFTGPAPAPATVSILASTSWLSTVSPVRFRTSASTPASGAGISSTTLSVSSSIRISSFSTASPGCLRHSSSVASGIDSASIGTLTSTVTALLPGHTSFADRSPHRHPPAIPWRKYSSSRFDDGRTPSRLGAGPSHALFVRDAAWSRPSAVSTSARCWLVCTLR